MEKDRLKFLFMVPVWGQHHRTLFTDVCLPMLLSDGNFGHFRGRKDIRVHVIAPYEDFLEISSSPAGRGLADLVPVTYEILDGLVDLSTPHEAMSKCYKLSMTSQDVVPGYTFFAFLSPDSFWSDGSFQRAEQLCNSDCDGILVCGLRTNYAINEPLLKIISENHGKAAIDARDLVSLSLRHLHPMAKAHNWLSESFLNDWPSNIYWKTDDKSMIAHCFHLHPLLVRSPKRKSQFSSTVDDDMIRKFGYSVERIRVVTNSDEMFGVEISPSDRSWGRQLGRPDLRRVQKFSYFHADSVHWNNFRHMIVMKGRGFKAIPSEVSRNIDRVVSKILRRRKFVLVFQRIVPAGIFPFLNRLFSTARYLLRRLLRALRKSLKRL